MKKIVGSDVLEDTAEFFGNLEGMYDGFKQRARDVAALLQSDATSFVVVTSPAEESVTEATFFAARLNESGLPFGALVVNRVHPRWADADRREAAAARAARAGRGRRPACWPSSSTTRRRSSRVVTLEEKNLDALARKVPRHRWVRVPYLEREAVDIAGLARHRGPTDRAG